MVCPFFASGDGFIYEYGKLELILEKDSQWQNIKIYKTERFGNMLCLDDDISKYAHMSLFYSLFKGIPSNCRRRKYVPVVLDCTRKTGKKVFMVLT